ncbi:hypothetical protein NPIL_259491 [Nephila pilipes]|uniref:Uncharacterized protein n=1 Tax=Nephila pilipes TaxID=299642 RepID=A0A8X6TCF4_NEPPI|nr:hypothetical protein NPIL_259491 [Nephila pilipes]
MGRQLRVQRPPIRNISNFHDRCLNIGYILSPVIYQELVASMPRRFEAVLRATACAYLKGHLIGLAKDWFDVKRYPYVMGTATYFAQLKQA